MKIALVGTYPLDPGFIRGGVEYVMVNLVEGLKQFPELELHVISQRPEVPRPRTFKDQAVTLHFLPATRRFRNLTGGWLDHYRVRQLIRALKPDLVHFQNAPAYAFTDGIRPVCPVLLTLHGIIHQEVKFEPGWRNRVRRYFRSRQERAALRQAPHLVTLNPYVETAVRPFSRAVMHRIDNPVDARYFELKRQATEGRILFVGFVSRLKNVMALIRAVQPLIGAHPELEVFVAGAVSDPAYFSEIEKWINAHALGSHIRFLGHLPENRLLAEYEQCSFLVSTSKHENSPIAVAQAMAAGKAVVATRVGGVPHLVTEGQTGFLVEPDQIEAMTGRIRTLLEDRALREAFGQSAREEAERRFSRSAVAAKTYNLYQELIGSYPGERNP